ncbi:MAG: serine/threonine protein kinase [Cyanobacteria bacterium]|nr:serine/threonine protein kinase [Cyanobacteriota bacterium]
MSTAGIDELKEEQSPRDCGSCGKRIRHHHDVGEDDSDNGPSPELDECSCAIIKIAADDELNAVVSFGPSETDFSDTSFPSVSGERFSVEMLIGKGGMSEVYRAHDRQLGTIVAVKVLRDSVASVENRSKLFADEIKNCQALDHGNIVAVLDHGTTDDDRPFAVMEYVDGKSLSDCAGNHKPFMEPREAIDVFLQICEGLAHAHARGIVHLDLKPNNVLCSQTDGITLVKLVDFGIARAVSTEREQMSESDEVIGSLPYMSPEQLNGSGIDFRSDIYSMGCLMYEVLTGRTPFEAENPVKVIMNHFDGLPGGLTSRFKRLEIPRDLEQIIRHCLEIKPENRYQCIEELTIDLEQARLGRKPIVVVRQNRQRSDTVSPHVRSRHRRSIFLVGLAGLVLYLVYLGQFDTTHQIVLFVTTSFYILGLAGSFFALSEVYPYVKEIRRRSKDNRLPGDTAFLISWWIFAPTMVACFIYFLGLATIENLPFRASMPFFTSGTLSSLSAVVCLPILLSLVGLAQKSRAMRLTVNKENDSV